jgi:hypothetical protein
MKEHAICNAPIVRGSFYILVIKDRYEQAGGHVDRPLLAHLRPVLVILVFWAFVGVLDDPSRMTSCE